jgi:hypothetical protein
MAFANIPGFAAVHPRMERLDIDVWFREILRDDDVVRIRMVFNGPPSLDPRTDQKPANGFIDLRVEIVSTYATCRRC